MKLDIMGEDTPGPGSYKEKKNMSDTPRMPSSAFRSSSAQRMKEHNHYTPSPGAYDVRKEAVEDQRALGFYVDDFADEAEAIRELAEGLASKKCD